MSKNNEIKSRNYNINRIIDSETEKFEKCLYELLDKFGLATIETETFDSNGNLIE